MTRPCHVLHVVPSLFGANDGITGGAERYVLELARHMAEEVPTTLVSFGEKDRQETIGQLAVRIIGNPWYVRGQRTNPFAFSLFGELRRADLVHCHQQHVLTSSLAALVCGVSQRKIFVTDLGGGGWDISGYISTDNWYQGHLHISEYSRKIYRQEGKPWAHVVFGGVDTAKFSPDESVSRQSKVLFVGRILPHKGIDDLIKALPPELALEIIGQPYDERYLADLRRMAVGKQVSFRHDCDDDERCDQRAATMRAHHPPPTFMDPAKTGGRMFARDKRFCGDSERVLMARRNVSGRRAGRFSSAGTGSPVLSGDARVARATTTMFTLRMLAGCPV